MRKSCKDRGMSACPYELGFFQSDKSVDQCCNADWWKRLVSFSGLHPRAKGPRGGQGQTNGTCCPSPARCVRHWSFRHGHPHAKAGPQMLEIVGLKGLSAMPVGLETFQRFSKPEQDAACIILISSARPSKDLITISR